MLLMENFSCKMRLRLFFGALDDLKAITETLDKVDVVIDTVVAPDPSPNRALRVALANSRTTSGKKRYIYTSGCLVYGDHQGAIVEEDKSPLSGFQWRIDFEKEIIADSRVEAAVIRPGWVYGGTSGRYICSWFDVAEQADIVVEGSPDKLWPWVHVTDLSDAFVAVASAASGLVAGQIFDVADQTKVPFGQLKEAFARSGGAKGKVVLAPAKTDAFGKAMEGSLLMSSGKIRRVLGWQPKQGPLLDNLPIYAASYKATK